MELWFDTNLVTKTAWECIIDDIKAKSLPEIKESECADLLSNRIKEAVRARLPVKTFGVFLSGGVDSSLLALLAQQLKGNFICYAVGFDGAHEPPDVVFARKVALKYGLTLRVKLFALDEVEELLEKAMRVLRPVGLTDSVHVCIGAVVIGAVELARPDGVDYFLGGLGTEEIFAGYARHLKVDDVQKECWRGLRAMWSTDLVRDAQLGKALGITVRTPYLDRDVIVAAMRIPGRLKVVDLERKVVFRKAAEAMGLLPEIAWRKKQAAQYGSGFDKALEKLAKKKGVTKGEYLNRL